MMATSLRGMFIFVAHNMPFIPILTPPQMWDQTIKTAGQSIRESVPKDYSFLSMHVHMFPTGDEIEKTILRPPTRMDIDQVVQTCLASMQAQICRRYGDGADSPYPIQVKITINP